MKTKTKRNHKSNVCNKFDTRKKLAIYIYLKKKTNLIRRVGPICVELKAFFLKHYIFIHMHRLKTFVDLSNVLVAISILNFVF